MTLRVILPDQLNHALVPEIAAEGGHALVAETGAVFSRTTHLRKLALVAAAGRHYAARLAAAGVPVEHRTIADGSHEQTLAEHVADAARHLAEHVADHLRLVALRPGSWTELHELERAAGELGAELEIREDPHFYTTPSDFAAHAEGRSRLVMEYFYREQRKRFGILMDGGKPGGGEWNYDSENRESFGADGPGEVPEPPGFAPDETTREAIRDVERIFPDAPGSLDGFSLPVTPEDARVSLDDFVARRLPRFGDYQDAMWSGSGVLYHSFLSPALNMRLLDPREAVAAAEEAWRRGDAPLNAVEGFVRQIVGWREYVRGVFYHAGEGYLERNALDANRRLPGFYWTGDTRMRCVSDVMSGVLRDGYAHHIERLMVMGLFSLLYGAEPAEVHEWHLALYLDAWEWVSAPNVIGMSQFADGGLVATKPYAASGAYIARMSNYCGDCPLNPAHAAEDDACPFTALYWDFLSRHRERLSGNRRMKFQLANLNRKDSAQVDAILARADRYRTEFAS